MKLNKPIKIKMKKVYLFKIRGIILFFDIVLRFIFGITLLFLLIAFIYKELFKG